MKKYYDILGIKPGASTEEIKKAYYKKVREFPPDRNQEKFIKIRKAYEKLKNPLNRAKIEIEVDKIWKNFEDMLPEEYSKYNFLGPEAWYDILKN